MGIYVWVALGGAIGTTGRYWLSGAAARVFGETFPWGTLIINVTGSFVIGFFFMLTGPDGRLYVGSKSTPVRARRHLWRLHHVLLIQLANPQSDERRGMV